MQEQSKNLAVLIDADNTSHNLIGVILEEIAKYGTAYVKYVYGDWSSSALKPWKDKCLSYGLIAVQQFAYTAQKNATDIAMVIDAMDLLYSKTFDGFCLVSSDSDFTGLASRIRRDGVIVYGLGKENTPEAFRKSCDKFIYTNNLIVEADEIESLVPDKNSDIKLSSEMLNVNGTDSELSNNNVVKKTSKELRCDTKLMNLFRNAIKSHEDENGWANLGVVGSYISKIQPEFDYRSYGFTKLSALIKAIDLFEYKTIGSQLVISNLKKKANDTPQKINSNIVTGMRQAINANLSPVNNGWVYLGDISNTLKGMNILYTNFGCSNILEFYNKFYDEKIETKIVGSQKFIRIIREIKD